MGLETTGDFIADLQEIWPIGSVDIVSEGDDHFRYFKDVVKKSFAGFNKQILIYGEAGGTDTYTVSPSPAPGTMAYGLGSLALIKFTNANMGAATLNVNGGGAKTILDIYGNALVSGSITAGSTNLLYYDGTNFILLSTRQKSVATRISHTFAVSGTLVVASGATGYIPPFYVEVPSGQVAELAGIRAACRNGSGSVYPVMSLQRNGVNVTGLASIDITGSVASPTTGTPSSTTTLSDGDRIAAIINSIGSGTPDGLTYSVLLDYKR